MALLLYTVVMKQIDLNDDDDDDDDTAALKLVLVWVLCQNADPFQLTMANFTIILP